MSLHAQLSSEAIEKLRQDKRNSTVSAIVLALLCMGLIAIIMGFIFLSSLTKETKPIVSFKYKFPTTEVPETPKVVNQVAKTPTAPASAISKVIVSANLTNLAIAVPDVDTPEASLEFGEAIEFGRGFENGADSGHGSSGATGFGSTEKVSGTLSGHLYDLKQNHRGVATHYDPKNRSHFNDPVNRIHRSRFSEASFKKFYKSPQELFIRIIAIPFSSADLGPKYFKAEKDVKPSGWLAHYQGSVIAPDDGTYRFVGTADDYIGVAINRKMRLVSGWPDIAAAIAVKGANADSDETPHQIGPCGQPLTYGSWFKVRKGEKIEINIALGERPGGQVGFLLLIEKQGEKYETNATGNAILPPFAVGPLHPDDIKYLDQFKGWKFETNKVPVFQAAH